MTRALIILAMLTLVACDNKRACQTEARGSIASIVACGR